MSVQVNPYYIRYPGGVTAKAETTVVALRLADSLLDQIQEIAQREGLNRSDAMRALLREAIAARKQPPPEPISDIYDLGLSIRVRNCLLRNQIETVSLLVTFSPPELLTLDGMGAGGLRAIEEALQQRGLSLAEAPKAHKPPTAAVNRASTAWVSGSVIYPASETHRRAAEADIALEMKALRNAKRLLSLYRCDQTNAWAALSTAVMDTFGDNPRLMAEMLARLAVRVVADDEGRPPDG